MKRYVGDPPSRPIDAEHRSILALLPEYVAICMLAQQLVPEWHAFEQHLGQCPACHGEADALLALMTDSYTGMIANAPAPLLPDLSFLDPAQMAHPPLAPRAANVAAAPRGHSFQPIVIQFSAGLVQRMQVHMAARSGGLHLRYAYEVPAADDDSPTITVEVLAHDDTPTVGLVRVCVEHPQRSPFEQAGTRVTLVIDDARWSGVTDQNGVTAFHDIPLAQIEQWQIRIEPQ